MVYPSESLEIRINWFQLYLSSVLNLAITLLFALLGMNVIGYWAVLVGVALLMVSLYVVYRMALTARLTSARAIGVSLVYFLLLLLLPVVESVLSREPDVIERGDTGVELMPGVSAVCDRIAGVYSGVIELNGRDRFVSSLRISDLSRQLDGSTRFSYSLSVGTVYWEASGSCERSSEAVQLRSVEPRWIVGVEYSVESLVLSGLERQETR